MSYLLVTPEVVKVVAPALTGMVSVILGGSLTVGPTMLAFAIGAHVFPRPSLWGLVTGGVVGLLYVVSLILFVSMWLKKTGEILWVWLAIRASRHLFAAGVVLFLLARLVSIYGAAVKAHAL
jgi:hypothetical protein